MSLKQQKKDNELTLRYYGSISYCKDWKCGLQIGVASIFTCTSSLVYCLYKVIGDKIPVQTILQEFNEEGKIIPEEETILESRIK